MYWVRLRAFFLELLLRVSGQKRGERDARGRASVVSTNQLVFFLFRCHVYRGVGLLQNVGIRDSATMEVKASLVTRLCVLHGSP